MIMSWFTQPQTSFASYYQYDTVTRGFCRIRLELNRSDKDATFCDYTPGQTVGFSTKVYSVVDPSKHWSVNDKGQLCYDGAPLEASKPTPGFKVYDTPDPVTFVHNGNAVTLKPLLPADIEPKHLALLANEALATGKSFDITPYNASPLELSDAIKERVCSLLDVDNWGDVNDELILSKLTSQAKSMRSQVVDDSASSLDRALGAANDASALINAQIRAGVFTPNTQFEDAFGALKAAVASAQVASGNSDVQTALTEITKAQQAVNTALDSIDTDENTATATQLNNAKDSLTRATQNGTKWQEAIDEYRSLSDADSISAYEKEIGIPTDDDF
jgi:hypothetical protein